MSAGSGVLKDMAAPLSGWANESVPACSAWRGKASTAAAASAPRLRAAARRRPP